MIPFLPLIFILYFLAVNIYSFFLFYRDKNSAKNKKLRVSEKKLLTLAAIGGSIGAFFGMISFHHKTKHPKFKILLPLFIIIHFVLLELIF